MPMPAAQCVSASAMVNHCGEGCLPATITLIAIVGAQTMIGDPQQRIGVGRKVDPHDIRLLVRDEIDEAGILMAEAVMVLPPDMGRQQIIQR